MATWNYTQLIGDVYYRWSIGYTIKYCIVAMETLHLLMNLLTFGKVALVNESGYDMRVLEVEVVMGTKYVGWDDTRETAAILFMISPLHIGAG